MGMISNPFSLRSLNMRVVCHDSFGSFSPKGNSSPQFSEVGIPLSAVMEVTAITQEQAVGADSNRNHTSEQNNTVSQSTDVENAIHHEHRVMYSFQYHQRCKASHHIEIVPNFEIMSRTWFIHSHTIPYGKYDGI
jgi:hypothetical protein